MGSLESKPEQPPQQENNLKETILSESAPSSPILTPLDPRSPSVNIARTPLETVLEPKITVETEDKDVVNVILGIDPRSPTVEFNRTPIIVGQVAKEKTKLQNKNLDNVRKLEIQTTPVSTTKNSNVVPPKLLDSSPISAISNANKRKSFVGLLETNIDFTETDLDTVQIKGNWNQSLPLEITDLPCNNLKDQMETLKIDKLNLEKCDKSETVALNKIEEKSINVTAQVKDFDKKLTNLIYEDDSDDDTKQPLKVIKAKEGNRTPLGNRNSNEDDKKSKNRLKVSDKPRKSELSKIPVFKDYHSRKMGVQCENTPPQMDQSMRKTKLSHWDADKTLII